jgi:hypothetical protein
LEFLEAIFQISFSVSEGSKGKFQYSRVFEFSRYNFALAEKIGAYVSVVEQSFRFLGKAFILLRNCSETTSTCLL